jgi:excisionase family DNA binding protein
MTKNNNTSANLESLLLANKKVLNVPELSEFTGLSKSWIYKLCQQRKIPHSCPNGKLLMFDREKIQDWLLSNPVSLAADVEREAINYIARKPWKEDTL